MPIGWITLGFTAASFGLNLLSSASSGSAQETSYKNNAFSYRQQADDLEEQALSYDQRVEDAKTQSGIALENASFTLTHGQNIFEQMTETHEIQRGGMQQQLGGSQAMIGRSGVEMAGSARRLVAENAVNMSRDLKALQKSAGNKWEQLMAERRSSIKTGHNLLEQADTFKDIAAGIRSRASSFDTQATKMDDAAESARTWWNPFD